MRLNKTEILTEILRYRNMLIENATLIIQKALAPLSELIQRGLLPTPEGRLLQTGIHNALSYNILICDYMIDFLSIFGDTGYYFRSSVDERLVNFKNIREVSYKLMQLNHNLVQLSNIDKKDDQRQLFIELEENTVCLLTLILKIKD